MLMSILHQLHCHLLACFAFEVTRLGSCSASSRSASRRTSRAQRESSYTPEPQVTIGATLPWFIYSCNATFPALFFADIGLKGSFPGSSICPSKSSIAVAFYACRLLLLLFGCCCSRFDCFARHVCFRYYNTVAGWVGDGDRSQ